MNGKVLWVGIFCFVWYCENGNFNLINEKFCVANNFNGYNKRKGAFNGVKMYV